MFMVNRLKSPGVVFAPLPGRDCGPSGPAPFVQAWDAAIAPRLYGLLARISGDGPRLARVRISTKPDSASQAAISSNE